MVKSSSPLEYFLFWRFPQGRRRVRTALAACLAVGLLPSLPAAAQSEIDVKLFDSVDVDRSRGCTVALWQADRSPQRDRFAYIFVESLASRTAARQPARVRIGTQAVAFHRVAAGGKTSTFGLSEYQLYKGPGADEFIILELKLGLADGEAVEIESGTMTVIVKGRQVFRAAVRGGAGCVNASTTASVQVLAPASRSQEPAPGGVPFDRYAIRANLVPLEIIRAAQERFGCAAELMRTNAVGFVISEQAAIWQMGCERLAQQTSSVYVLVQFDNPARSFRFIEFRPPRGRERPIGSALLFDPDWNLQARTVTSITRSRAQGDCGTLERHRVTGAGEFVLTEYREKRDCDGNAGRPQDWPLVFRAN